MFCGFDVSNYSTMSGKWNDQDPVTRNEVDQSLEDACPRLSAWVAASVALDGVTTHFTC
jgi:hypothetical protein